MKSDAINNLINTAFRAMLESTNDLVFVKDENHMYVAASVSFVKMTGRQTLDEIIGKTDFEIFDDENLAKRYISDDKKLLAEGQNLVDYIEPLADNNGHARYGSTCKYILYDDNGKTIGLLGITRDITRDYIARQIYQRELQYLFEMPGDTYAVSYIDVDSWRIISQRRQMINENAFQACNTIDELCEFAIESIIDKDSSAFQFYSSFTADSLREIYKSGKNTLSFTYQRQLTGMNTGWVHNEIRFIMDVDSGHLCAMLSAKDINAEKTEQQNLITAAKMDKMTMLLNRATTMESIKKVLDNESEHTHALFMIDVDNFKSLNDTLGHQTGDRFLIALSKELKRSFRESDIVGRIGGDEFFVLVRKVAAVNAIVKKAEELLDIIRKVCNEYPGINLSGSIGISLYPENASTLEELYNLADNALYQAKRTGKNQFVFAQNGG